MRVFYYIPMGILAVLGVFGIAIFFRNLNRKKIMSFQEA